MVDVKAIKENYPDLLCMEEYDDAIIGVVERCGTQAICYDYQKILEILMFQDGMPEEDARDYIAFNIVGAWVGEHTPFVLITE